MDAERAERIAALMERQGFAALVCRQPEHVLALTGYLSMLGNVFAVVARGVNGEPEVRLAVPEDERDAVPSDAAVEIQEYIQASLQFIGSVLQAARGPLATLFRSAGVASGKVGYEGGHVPVVPAYTQVASTGPATLQLFRELLPGASFADASGLIEEVMAIKTPAEIVAIRRAVAVAAGGMRAAREAVRAGATEADVAAAAYAALLRAGYAQPGVRHVLPNVHVMAGPRAAQAYKDANLTSNAPIGPGQPVSVQMEVGVNGYWAELTRPFFAVEAPDLWRRVHSACVGAQDAALALIRDGVSGKEADAAARTILAEAGFGEAFKHGLGHGFGFQAINLNAEPILHPQSTSILRANMLHNIEPAAYFDRQGGFRLNDDVLVQHNGCERISAAVPRDLAWLVMA